MTDISTSLAHAGSLRGEWRSYFAFLRSPKLPAAPTGFSGAALKDVFRLYALDLSFMAVLLVVATLAISGGTAIPKNSVAEMPFGLQTALAIVLLAPVIEEILFRSWLSGKPGHLFLIPVLAIAALLGPALVQFVAYQILAAQGGGSLQAPVAVAIVAAFFIAIYAAGLYMWRGRPPYRWFAKLFPLFYAISTIGFAFIHVFNFPEASVWVVLPFVLPQLLAGSIFGFARVRYGLWSSMLLHALHNGTFVAIVFVGLQMSS
ncbi:CPBP family intramembrane metalloprotease [Erythrobacter litoralis]|uniref:CPBP family glutamic-type intramembrane protease n=1 Tax=Erythrobacter litoralis TaxID=39960 RepID=UPI002434F5AA|nr:CPBP family glutamic-type intramembrane protease [Erythrobacter litoralis]MDG6080072.1 CPBP family intramembrane metalloprotease [Erythrobacter litoralis]